MCLSLFFLAEKMEKKNKEYTDTLNNVYGSAITKICTWYQYYKL